MMGSLEIVLRLFGLEGFCLDLGLGLDHHCLGLGLGLVLNSWFWLNFVLLYRMKITSKRKEIFKKYTTRQWTKRMELAAKTAKATEVL